jgi:hypothetical protein
MLKDIQPYFTAAWYLTHTGILRIQNFYYRVRLFLLTGKWYP